jgi:protein-tyrosine phosphatase
MKIFLILFMIILLPANIHAQRRNAPNREVTLEGAVNFRDMGGYVTTDYRRIKWERIYRAADISKLTDSDMEELKRRKIYTVIDFRGEKEAENAPDCLLPGTDYLLLPAGSGNTSDMAEFTKGSNSGTEVMKAFYSDISAFKEKYRPFFLKLLTLPDTSAIVFHCSAGKDRTGIAVALLLYALEIPMETIFSDYVSTNHYREEDNKRMIDYMVNEQGIDRRMAGEIMTANPQYLEAMFNALKKKYGSIDVFFYNELGIGEDAKLILREKYLQ